MARARNDRDHLRFCQGSGIRLRFSVEGRQMNGENHARNEKEEAPSYAGPESILK